MDSKEFGLVAAQQLFNIEDLHYGFWDHPEEINPQELTLDDMVKAQDRYIEHLATFIPEDVKSILDVGAGIGGNSSYLLSKGYLHQEWI